MKHAKTWQVFIEDRSLQIILGWEGHNSVPTWQKEEHYLVKSPLAKENCPSEKPGKISFSQRLAIGHDRQRTEEK